MAKCRRENELEIGEWVAVISVVVALVSLAHQLHLTRRQNMSEVKAKQYDRTTALLFKAMDNPDLLEAISGGSDGDQRQRRFRQIWINHAQMIFGQKHLLTRSEWSTTVEDIKDFMGSTEVTEHWQEYREFYPEAFREFIDNEVYATKKEDPTCGSSCEVASENQASTT